MAKAKVKTPENDDDLLEHAMRDPRVWRHFLNIDGASNAPVMFGSVAEEWQHKDLCAMDPCLKYIAGVTPDRPLKNCFWLQYARGHNKTGSIAMQVAWLLAASKKNINGIAGAADRDQAKLISDAMKRILSINPWLESDLGLKHTKYEVSNVNTGSSMVIMSADAASSFGSTPNFTLCDEFTHWGNNENFWSSLASSFAKKEESGMLIVACNAGAGKDWKWRVREAARTLPEWYFSAPEGVIAGWITQKTLNSQRRLLPPTEYSRLWDNKWQETAGEFVTLAEAKACEDWRLNEEEHGVEGWEYVATVDFAEKRDYTVGCVGHVYDRRIIVDRMDVIVPQPNRPTKTSWVLEWMRNVQREFRNVRFVVDPYQLLTVMEMLSDEGFDIHRFEFMSGVGNYEIAMALRQAILHGVVAWYPGCGALTQDDAAWVTEDSPDDLTHELASLITVKTHAGKRWRFDHLQDEVHHDDRSFCLGVLVHYCCKANERGYDYFGIDDPIVAAYSS